MASQEAAFFRVGGTLGPDAASYVVREADEELLRLVLGGDFCYVLTARQLGKSSLMVRTAKDLQSEGVFTATVELTQIGTQGGVDAWYISLISQIHAQLELSRDYQAWWNERLGHSPVQRFSDFLRQVVLGELPGKVVIFIDEIDTTLNLNFSDDFFAAIRAVYNARASDPEYERLTFVLLGVAMPGDLIEDRTRTPFNIGQGVRLQDFGLGEGDVLQEGLEVAYPEKGESIFARIYHWTRGHPYLSQKLCAAAVQSDDKPWDEERVDALVEKNFFAEEASRKESNLQFVRDRIRASPDAGQLLRLYRQVLGGKKIADEDRSTVKSRLKLYGLVRATPDGMLAVRNRIYERVFDLEWVKEEMPRELTRWVVGASVLVTVLALMVAGYFYIQAQRQTVEFYVEQFRTSTSPDVRVTSLAGLMRLSGYENEAQRLFFEELSVSAKVAMFGVSDPQTMQDSLIVVVKGLYTKLSNTAFNNVILEAMRDSLSRASSPVAKNLFTEIDQWLLARELYAEGEYQDAIDAYGVAISLNDRNPETHIDRALACAALEHCEKALLDLERAFELDQSLEDRVKQIVNQKEGLFTYVGIHPLEHQVLADWFPTLTATLTNTPEPTYTHTPTSTPIPRPSHTPTPSPTHTPSPSSTVTPSTTPTSSTTPSSTPSLITVTPTPTPTPKSSLQTSPVLNGRIAVSVVEPGTGTYRLLSIRPDGTDRLWLGDNLRQPSYRQDGLKIVANGQGGGMDDLWKVNPDGSGRIEAFGHLNDEHPIWLQASRYYRVGFDSLRWGDGDWRIYAGDIPISYTGGAILGRYPVWVPGGYVVYNGCDYGFGNGSSCGLYRVSMWGGTPTRLTEFPNDIPTGGGSAGVLFMREVEGNWDVYLVGLGGGDPRRLTNDQQRDGLATFSPDERTIAFLSERSGTWAIWLMNRDGSNQRRIYDLPWGGGYGADWSSERMSWGPPLPTPTPSPVDPYADLLPPPQLIWPRLDDPIDATRPYNVQWSWDEDQHALTEQDAFEVRLRTSQGSTPHAVAPPTQERSLWVTFSAAPGYHGTDYYYLDIVLIDTATRRELSRLAGPIRIRLVDD